MFSSASRDLSLLPGPTGQKLLILLQGLMSSLTFITALSAVSYMPVPDALCIVFSCPVVTIILSALVLKVMDVSVMIEISDKFPLSGSTWHRQDHCRPPAPLWCGACV